MKKSRKLSLAYAIAAAASLSATELPWVYDQSGRNATDTKSTLAAAYSAGDFMTMARCRSYESNLSRLRTVPWVGLMIVVK